MQEIKDIFNAESKSIFQFLATNGQGLYIPAYQRPYSWGDSQLSKLFSDAVHGFKTLTQKDSSVESAATFLGSIIAIHDTTNSTVIPENKNGLPSKVMTIIDGQQRLTSLLILVACLHKKIEKEFLELFKDKRNPEIKNNEDKWLLENTLQTAGDLFKCILDEQNYGTGVSKWYPRMTRSYEDFWNKDKGKYDSPIGRYLFGYVNAIYDSVKEKCIATLDALESFDKAYNKKLKQKDASVRNLYAFSNGASIINTLVNKFYDEDSSINSESEVPSFYDLGDSDIAVHLFNNQSYLDEVKNHLKTDENDKFNKLTRLIFFASFVLNRICLTVITAKNEDYAFDIFESLNTTGEPLTALETFKPKVIYWKELSKYECSYEKQLMDNIDSYIDSAKDKSKATQDLLIYFAYGYSGDQLSNRINDQRRYMRKFDSLTTDNDKIKFIQVLSDTASFMKNVWSKENLEIRDSFNHLDLKEVDTVRVCINFLIDLKHTMTIPLLVRYYANVLHSQNADENQKNKAEQIFANALKAITAFAFLWRSSRTTTDRIDQFYRDLMKLGVIERKKIGFTSTRVKPICAKSDDLQSVYDLKKIFKEILANIGKVNTKSDWIEIAKNQEIYTISTPLTRFMLLAAEDRAVIDQNTPYLITRGKDQLTTYLTYDAWNNNLYKTIEHIAPENNSNWSQSDIYSQTDHAEHHIGNLTLLPLGENASLSNYEWSKKLVLYKILAAETEQQASEIANNSALKEVFNELDSIRKKASGSKYLVFAKAISNYSGNEWNRSAVDERGARICELAWNTIENWCWN